MPYTSCSDHENSGGEMEKWLSVLFLIDLQKDEGPD